MSKIVFAIPDKDAPGFLRRQRQALVFAEKARRDMTPDTLDELVLFLSAFVTEPVDRGEAREALFDATETQIIGLLNSITGGAAGTPPLSVLPSDKS